jgi:hypothetical protein
MVRPTPKPDNAGTNRFAGKHSASALAEEMRALLGIFEALKTLISDWHARVAHESDETMLAVAYFYGDLCRDLDRRMVEFKEAAAVSDEAVDLEPIRRAREHLWAVSGFDPAEVLESIKEARAGRFVTLEQMRGELRNPSH